MPDLVDARLLFSSYPIEYEKRPGMPLVSSSATRPSSIEEDPRLS
jgi:hypothetical protein